MRDGVLFEITKEHLETGLRGIPVGYCVTSSVDPQKGLTYVGRPVTQLIDKDPLEILYLLYFGEMGSQEQVRSFQESLAQRAQCQEKTLDAITHLPRSGHPMDLFAAAILITGMFEGTGDYREDCLNLMACMPQIAAACINHHAGWGKTPASEPNLSYMGNFVHMLQAPIQKTDRLVQVMRLFDLLSFDHSGGNLSAFVGKCVASGLEHMHGSIAAAMTALAGPRHGRANQDCLEFLQEIMNAFGQDATLQQIETFVRQKLEKKELIYGFGHAVLRVEDPRATVCYRFCEEHFPNDPWVRVALKLRIAGTKVLKENPKVQNPYPNIDAITGAMLSAAGFAYPEYFTVLFGMSRALGIAIQIVYERLEAKEKKGLPIVRPKYIYKGR